MATPHNPHRDRLAARLQALRAATGYSGNRFADLLGWQQSKVSKIETGRQLPRDSDLDAWTRTTDPNANDELAALLAAARVEYAAWRGVARTAGGFAARQAEIGAWEATATQIAEYQPGFIPGLVQTAAYAREALGLPPGPVGAETPATDQMEWIIAARMRRQEVLYQPDRTVRVIIGEAALWAAPGQVDTLRGQLGKLQTVADLPAVELGIVPLHRMPVMPLSGFRLYDGSLVVVETLGGEQQLEDHDEVTGYGEAFSILLAAADTGDAAVGRIRHVLSMLEER